MIAWCERRTRETLAAVLFLGFLAYLVAHVAGCTPFWQAEGKKLAVETVQCILSKLDLPNDQIAIQCGVPAAERAVMDLLLAQAREQAAKQAADAAARAKAERCSADGGSP